MRSVGNLFLATSMALVLGCNGGMVEPDGGQPDENEGRDSGPDTAEDTTGTDTVGDVAADKAVPPDVPGPRMRDPELVKRGAYLVDNIALCGMCHTPREQNGRFDQSRYLGGVACLIDFPLVDSKEGGPGPCLPAKNLTNHETGLKNHSDQEIKDMFMHGIRPNGTTLATIMPYYRFANLTDRDADAIVAYLRTLTPIDFRAPPKTEAYWLYMPQAEPLDLSLIPLPMENYPDQEAAMRGRYLTGTVGFCADCHTPERFPDRWPYPTAMDDGVAFIGGRSFWKGAFFLAPAYQDVILSKNITSDPETGIGNYTIDQIVDVLHAGIDPEGRGVCPPMPSGPVGFLGGLTDEDTADIAHYLKSIPPVFNEVANNCIRPGT